MPRLYQTPSYELWWEPSDGTICLKSPGRMFESFPGVEFTYRGRLRQVSGAELVSGRISQETLNDEHGRGQIVQIHYLETSGLALTLRIRLYQTRPFVLLQIAVTNVGPETVYIRRFFVHATPGGVQATASPRGFFSNGWQSLSPAGYQDKDKQLFLNSFPYRWGHNPKINNTLKRRFGRKGMHISEMVGAVITPNEALIGGCVTTADQFVQFWADLSSGNHQVGLQSQADDGPLDVGASLLSEWFYLEWVPLPNDDPFAQYAHAIIRQMGVGNVRTVSPGWRSRDNVGQTITEADIFASMTSAALFGSELPIKRIEINDGYQSNKEDWGVRDEERFPHDNAWIAKRIIGSGFVPGISLTPLIVHPRSALAHDHPDWLLRNERNAPVHVRLPDLVARCLDATNPAVLDYLKKIIDVLVNQWDYKAIHLDYMYTGALVGRRYNPRMTRAQALRRVYSCIREIAGQDVFISAGQSPFGPAVGLVDAMQTSPTSVFSWESLKRNLRTKRYANRMLPSMRNTLLNTINRAWMHRRLWVNDPGPLMLQQNNIALTRQELLTQITLIGLSGTAISISDDLADITLEHRALLTVLFPPLLDGLDAVDLFESSMPELVVVKMARSWGRWQLVGLFNWSDDYVERNLPHSLQLDAQNEYHLVNFWEQRYFRIKQENAWPVLHLDPHSVVLLSLRPVNEQHAHIVGSTFHISQGGEISEIVLGDCSITAQLCLERTAQGSVWLALPSKPTQIYIDDVSLDLAAVRTVAVGIYAITFIVRGTAQMRVSWSKASPKWEST